MTNMMEIKNETEEIFNEELKVPEPSIHWKRKLEALEEAELENQYKACLFDMRCEQAKLMGFKRFKSDDLVEMLMGEKHTHTGSGEKRQNHEFMYNHHTGITLIGDNCNWGGNPTLFYHKYNPTSWFLPPFSPIEKWRCQFGKLDYLKRTIPYGVVLKINEVKRLNLFNVFNVLAPMEAWELKTDIDPIVVATIWEINGSNVGQSAHFFLAQW